MRDDDLIDGSDLRFESAPLSPRMQREFDSPFRFASKDAWRSAQIEYESGQPARLICRAYGLSLSTFRTRARNEGWRRADMMPAGEALEHDPVSLEPPPAPPTPDLVDLAWRSAAEAIRCGKVYEARAWMRIVDELKVVVKTEASAARLAEREAAAAAASAETETPASELHPLHPDRGVQDAAEPVLEPAHMAELEALEAKAAAGALSPDEASYVRRVREAVKAIEALPIRGAARKAPPCPPAPDIAPPSRPDEPQMKPDWQMFKENLSDFSG